MRLRFLRTALFISLTLGVVLAYPLYTWANAEVIRAVVASGIIAVVNIIIGGITLEYAIDKNNSRFMTAVFGGMGVRMGLILIAVTILLINGYHALALSLSLMGFYVVFMIAEITYAVRELSRRNPRTTPASRRKPGNTSFRSISVDHRSN